MTSVTKERKFLNAKMCFRLLKANSFVIAIIFGILIGFLIGFTLKFNSCNNASELALWFKLPGKLFMRSLQMLIMPVIFFGVITATSTFDVKKNAKISILCLITAILATFVSSITGAIASLFFRFFIKHQDIHETTTANTRSIQVDRSVYDIVSDILRNLIPNNIVKATMYQELTRYKVIMLTDDKNNTNSSENIIKKRLIEDIQSSNILGIMVFAVLIGIACSILKEKGEPFRKFIISINEIVILVLRWLIMLTPIGVSSLIIEAVLEITDLKKTFKEVWVFALIVTLCCLFHIFVTMALLFLLIARKLSYRYLPKLAEPFILAFASTSGAVCIPSNIKVLEEKLSINKSISRFCIPFFTTLKSDGSVIFVTVATVFLARINNYTLGFGDYIVVIIMTCMICLSAPPVPSASLITILAVMRSINLFDANIAILYTVEWLLDRVRTSTNVLSHNFCTLLVDELTNGNVTFQESNCLDCTNETNESSRPLNSESQSEEGSIENV